MVALAPQLTQRVFRWTVWKTVYAIKGLPFQYEDDGQLYTIWTYDTPEVHLCQIWKGTVPDSVTGAYSQEQNDADKADFEANYKSLGNLALGQIDTDGATIIRMKAAKRGWTYGEIPIEFATARLQSDTNNFYAKLPDGTDRSGITCKIYNGSDAEITTAGLANINLNTAVKTILDFEPAYDYEVIGGSLRTINDITADIRMYIIGVPDIPAIYGGSKEMAGGLNLNYMVPASAYTVDGRVSKTLRYDATYHTSKLRLVFKYPAGTYEQIQLSIELYRP